jgi:hypothetical protein
MLNFKVGSRVSLSPAGAAYYGAAQGAFIPESQGGKYGRGTVLVADETRPHDPRAAARPYIVQWDNGSSNSYREEDLVCGLLTPFDIVNEIEVDNDNL